MSFKPMLAATCKDLDKIQYPVLASIKLDGVRATVQGGRLLSRTLKPIPNANVQALFAGLPEGLDGELILGSPTAPDCYRRTVSLVMSDDKPADGIMFYVFDIRADAPFTGRLSALVVFRDDPLFSYLPIIVLSQRSIAGRADLDVFEAATVGQGHEGIMIRKPDGPYKEGRSTEREGFLLKIKRFADSEAVVLGFTELMHNANEAKTNELGRTARSSHKAGLVGTGTLGALCVRGLNGGYKDVEFEIGTGFTADERLNLFNSHMPIVGRIAKYKYFASGSKDKPRFPVFLGWRDPRDV